MVFFVYAIQSQSSKKIYIGQTDNLVKRLSRHNRELPTKTKSYTYKNTGPWKVVYSEQFLTRDEALKREKELKSYKGREFIKNGVLAQR